MSQMNLAIHADVCTGCKLCELVCSLAKEGDVNPAKARIHIEVHLFQGMRIPRVCVNCSDFPCAKACPSGAIYVDEATGFVLLDPDKCNHCGQDVIRVFSAEKTRAPCEVGCPAGVGIQSYLALIGKGHFEEALKLIRERMPLPAACGRVCHHPCEMVCNRKDVDESVAIGALKRFVSDYVPSDTPTPPLRTRTEKVAIVGSGPAGLAAAYDLVRKGYGVTIFEALRVAGGMLAVGIPEYRLPKKVLQKDIEYLMRLGIEIKLNTPLGDGLRLVDLAQQGYAATFIAIGAHKSQRLEIPGEDLEGVKQGTSFLREANMGQQLKVGKKVAVIGGGNIAIDSARAVRRLGAKEVTIVYRRSREEMPAYKEEIAEAESEGIKLLFLAAPTRVLGQGGKVVGVECIRMKLGKKLDETGRRKPIPITGSEFTIDIDMLIPAIGQELDLSGLPKELEITDRGSIAVDPVTLITNLPGVFAGGDAITGPATFIDAVAAGQRAAVSIDRYLSGQDLKKGRDEKVAEAKVEISPRIEKRERQRMPLLPIAARLLNFSEVSLGFPKETAIAEAGRCMRCAGMVCKEVCPFGAVRLTPDNRVIKCDLCGGDPECVKVCTTEAISFAPRKPQKLTQARKALEPLSSLKEAMVT